MNIAPYTPGKSKLSGISNPIKLSSNENPLGCSPKVLEAYRNFKDLNRYPDAMSTEMRQAIGKVHGLNPDKLICGSGSDELLGIIAHAYAGEGDEVIYSRHGFLVYPIATRAAGAKPVAVEENDFNVDIEGILSAVTPKTRIVFFANPNNPTGTYNPKSEIEKLRKGLRDDILLVIDSAYAECADAADYTDGREIVDQGNNTIMLRTFSKVYGIAALRLGWGYADPSIIDILNRVRPVFNISGPTLAAGIAAVNDQEFVKKSVEHNNKWREKLFKKLENLGLDPIPSQTNFVTARFGNDATSGKKGYEFLAGKGIITREIGNYHMPEYLRISIGTDEEMAKLFAALEEYKK